MNLKKLADIVQGPGLDRYRRVSDVREQAPIQGEFPVVLIRWRDITSHVVDSVEGDPRLSGRGFMFEFLQVGVKVFEDDQEVVLMHSMSVQPGRSEFFVFPRGVVLEEFEIGRVAVEDEGFRPA